MGIEVDGPLVSTAAEKELTEGAARLAGHEASWLDALADHDESGGWGEHGFFSCATWLAAACGIARITAREKLRVARGLQCLRGVRAAFRAGTISYSAVRAITRVEEISDDMEEALLEVAATGTVEDLEYLAEVWREYRGQERATSAMRRLEKTRDTRAVHVGEGLELDSMLPTDEGELLLGAMHETAGGLPPETPLGEKLTEGLIALAEHWRTTRAVAGGRVLPALTVSVDLEAMLGQRFRATVGGRTIPAETALRLACDAKVSRLLTGPRSEPLDVRRPAPRP